MSSLKANLQFPRISRFIPEGSLGLTRFHLKIFLVSFVCGFLLMAISLQAYSLTRLWAQLQSDQTSRVKLAKERSYWEDVVQRHNGYRDGYFKIALLSYQLGDMKTATTYLQKTLTIDPNFTEAKAFAAKIEK